jgi:hypothetical protein
MNARDVPESDRRELVRRTAREIVPSLRWELEHQDELEERFVVLFSDGRNQILRPVYGSKEERMRLYALLTDHAFREEAIAAIWIAEVWAAPEHGGGLSRVRPSNVLDRREAILLLLMTPRSGWTETQLYLFHRTRDEKTIIWETAGIAEGTIDNLFAAFHRQAM